MSKAIVVLSGGQDSTLCLALAIASREFSTIKAISFDYGQRHSIELVAAREVAMLSGIHHEIIEVGPMLQGMSPLTNPAVALDRYESFSSMEAEVGSRVEKTFVPMRNALFLTIAANRAVVMGATAIFTGVCQADNANYPDCREIFIEAQEVAINEALGYDPYHESFIQIRTPLMQLDKSSAILLSIQKGAYPLFAFTHTAYDGKYPPVGKDHASLLRARGFEEAGVPDPLVVRAHMEGLMDLPTTNNYTNLLSGFIPNLKHTIGVMKAQLEKHHQNTDTHSIPSEVQHHGV